MRVTAMREARGSPAVWICVHKAIRRVKQFADNRRRYEEKKDKINKQKAEYAKTERARALRSQNDKRPEKRAKITKYQKERLLKNPQAAAADRCRKRVWLAMKTASKRSGVDLSKFQDTMSLIGCTPEQLIEHLGVQKWQNRGKMKYHIDHIWPCAMYNLCDPEEQKKCFNWRNLQLLTAGQNAEKGSKPPHQSIGDTVPEEIRPVGWHY